MTPARQHLNGINPQDVHDLVARIKGDVREARSVWGVTTRWTGGTTVATHVANCTLGSADEPKDFVIRVDEPVGLGGKNTAPNPQETLLAALNSCMTVGYAALCTLEGIRLESLEIETEGEIDLRGFLGLAPVTPGYDRLRYTVRIKADATDEQLQRIHRTVMKTSPNRWNLAEQVQLDPTLVIA
ncbi:MAG: OsmC family peroxiredoxin [Planctomycetes bacterium]|nr:OsmC family peroxiredoxin [Planctomycetota bacterium]